MERSKTGEIKFSVTFMGQIYLFAWSLLKLRHPNVSKGHDRNSVCCHIADFFGVGHQDCPWHFPWRWCRRQKSAVSWVHKILQKMIIFIPRPQDLNKRSADFNDNVPNPEPEPSMCSIDSCKVLCRDLEETEIVKEILKLDLEVSESFSTERFKTRNSTFK